MLKPQFDFDRYARSLKANVQAIERATGRPLTNSECNQVAVLVGKIEGHLQRAGVPEGASNEGL